MRPGLNKIFGRFYEPLNLIEISKANLSENYQYLSSLNKGVLIAPVLKSNAYGHGIVLIAKEIDRYRPAFFCVDSLYEAYELLKNGVKSPILIMGYFNPKSLQTKKLPFSFAVFNKEQVISISKYQPQAKIHVFIDTGMHREGILINQLENFLNFIKIKTNLEIEGLMSHFALSEKLNDPNTQKQIKLFKTAQEITKNRGIFPRWIHIANSSGLLNYKNYNLPGNVARVGLALYGIDPAGKDNHLKPLLKFTTHIAEIKQIKNKDRVGYGFKFQAKKEMKIAILPLGYHDGVDRRLSDLGKVQIKEKYCPIIGRVSMNITTIDISNIPNSFAGQEVVIYSREKKDINSIENSAYLAKTIPYELLVHLDPSTKRILT